MNRLRNGIILTLLGVGAGLLVTAKEAVESHQSGHWNEIQVEATAYCPCSKCCGKFADGITATGRDALTKGVAVDKTMIPLGSTVLIPGYGEVEADDVGGAIKDRRIDVRFPTHEAALQWGRQQITIYYRSPDLDFANIVVAPTEMVR